MEIKQKYHKSRRQVKTAELPLLGAYNTTGFIFHLKIYCFLFTARYVQRNSILCKVLWFIPPPAPISLFSMDNVPDKWFILSQEQQCHLFAAFRVLERSVRETPCLGKVHAGHWNNTDLDMHLFSLRTSSVKDTENLNIGKRNTIN